MGATRPFSYGRFSLFQGRDSFSLESAEISVYFEALSSDLELACFASYFAELTDYYAREFAPEPELLKLLSDYEVETYSTRNGEILIDTFPGEIKVDQYDD